ncbi:MAG: alpha-L-fucosidase [Flavobacteriaceae bacterium]|jgi:alpha-L-fucosidase|nr:alpha-L-fucosidase [Flavobacteriaceae bacterium]
MKKKLFFFISIVFLSCETYQGPKPTKRQLEWQKMEYYAFVHFNMNTFTNKEWGFGDEKPSQFNPTEFDPNQWARICKEAGMKGIIITAKHHDGFCLWPSKFTEHSVKNSIWKNGKGDAIREISDACKKYGLKFGVYLSPWDRNHSEYGKESYITYFRNQLTELLTNYGEVFEVWFDGANGGSGYYGGSNEERRVDKRKYYDWENTVKLVRDLQPNAVIFSDGGPDIRWVGNEKGYAHDTSWSTIYRDSVYGGMPDYNRFSKGQKNGTHWIPTETDVSIRPGWYYHPEQDNQVKTLTKLREIYYSSIGKNSSLLLNIPVDKRGIIHENDAKELIKLKNQIDKDFKTNLILNKKSKSNQFFIIKNNSNNINDGDNKTYWSPNKNPSNWSVNFTLDNKIKFNTVLIRENIPLGQRVVSFKIEINDKGKWKKIKEGSTIGNKRILTFPHIETNNIRLTVLESKATPQISEFEIYNTTILEGEKEVQ